ncbi:hypothetical protein D3C77_634480 [compost metagenome]
MQLQIAAIGQDLEELVIKDVDKDIVLKEVPVIKVEDGLTTVEVNIGGVNTLYVYATAKKDGAVFVPLTTSQYK